MAERVTKSARLKIWAGRPPVAKFIANVDGGMGRLAIDRRDIVTVVGSPLHGTDTFDDPANAWLLINVTVGGLAYGVDVRS